MAIGAIRRAGKHAWARTLAVYAGVVLAYLVYGRLSFYRDPGSMFFDSARATERRYSDYREHEIKQYVGALAMGSDETAEVPATSTPTSSPSICAAMATIKRDSANYAPLAVASLVQGLSACERADIRVHVLLAQTNTSTHPLAQLGWLHSLIDEVRGYEGISAEQRAWLAGLEASNDYHTKGIFDYTYALQSCYDTGAPYVAVFEDDIILADGWLVQALDALHTIQSEEEADEEEGLHSPGRPSGPDAQAGQPPAKRDWLYMRLFNQELATGWASKQVGGNRELLISACIAGPVLLSLLAARRRVPGAAAHLDNASIALICALAIPTFVVLFFQAGKASLLPPAPGVRRENFGCCSQALVFPRRHVPRIQEYLRYYGQGQIDILLNSLAYVDGHDRYSSYPVTAQHIGQQSSRGMSVARARSVWSLAYENLSPYSLRRQHARLIEKLYQGKCELAG